MPMIPLLMIFAAHAAVTLARATRPGRLATLAAAVPGLIILALFINRDPGNSRVFEAQNHGILGEMYLEAERPAEAVTEFESALHLMDEVPSGARTAQDQRMIASAHFGIVLAGTDRSEDEMLAHLSAAAVSPDADTRRDALSRLGGVLMVRGDAAGAADAFAGSISADPSPGPDGFQRRLALAEALHKSGRAAEALAAVKEALGGAPPSIDPVLLADAHYGAALIYLHDIPDPSLAARELQEVLRLNPQHQRAEWIRRTLASLATRPQPPNRP